MDSANHEIQKKITEIAKNTETSPVISTVSWPRLPSSPIKDNSRRRLCSIKSCNRALYKTSMLSRSLPLICNWLLTLFIVASSAESVADYGKRDRRIQPSSYIPLFVQRKALMLAGFDEPTLYPGSWSGWVTVCCIIM